MKCECTKNMHATTTPHPFFHGVVHTRLEFCNLALCLQQLFVAVQQLHLKTPVFLKTKVLFTVIDQVFFRWWFIETKAEIDPVPSPRWRGGLWGKIHPLWSSGLLLPSPRAAGRPAAGAGPSPASAPIGRPRASLCGPVQASCTIHEEHKIQGKEVRLESF